ncbi:PucR family transcriptional regulator, partial [Streptomyces carpinensis]
MARPEVPEEYLEGYTRILADVCATGRRLTRDELESLRVQGERAAEAGHGLRTLVRRHLAEARAFSPALATAGIDRVLA